MTSLTRPPACAPGVVRRLWRARWSLLRIMLVGVLLWALASDEGPRRARLSLAALADLDHLREGQRLLGERRYSDATLMVDAGLSAAPDPARRASLVELRGRIELEQGAWSRRLRDAARGALLGGAGADEEASIEALLGAVAADFFVFGDVRDLAIQGTRALSGDDTDPVIVALSAIGLATTLAPEVDWAPALLKAARRAGALTGGMGQALARLARTRDLAGLRAMLADVRVLGNAASPAGAARLLRAADSPADLSRMARFVSSHGAPGAAALRLTGRGGSAALRNADELRAAGQVLEAARTEASVLRAARKGEAGGRWLASGAYRALARPHPLVGVLKGVWKGHAAELVERALGALDPHARWLIPLLAGWLFLELGLLIRRLTTAPRA